MAVDYAASLKTTRMTAVVSAIDAGAGAGKLKIYTSADALLVTITLNDPCGTVSGAVLTFAQATALTANATGTGTAAKATVTDSTDAVVVSGLVVGATGSGADVELNSTSVTTGQSVTITAAQLTHG